MTSNSFEKMTKVLFIIVTIILFVVGLNMFVIGCSPIPATGNGGIAVIAMMFSFMYLINGTILWLISGWAIVVYKISTHQNRKVSISGAAISLITGLLLLYAGILNYITRSHSEYMLKIPEDPFWLLGGMMFIVVGINAIRSMLAMFKEERETGERKPPNPNCI